MAAGIPVHVVQRGNNRAACFFADADRAFYLLHLQRLLPWAQCALHAYCLMSNHVHLLLTPRASDDCARLMKQLGQLYTQYVNRTYRRTGTLWEGRFKSCLVQSERYLLACYRYIELNPVRAGITDRPAAYEWSSYRTNAERVSSALVTPHPEYLRLGSTPAERCKNYSTLFGCDTVDADAIRNATHGNFALGDKVFQAELAEKLGRRVHRQAAGRRPQSGTDHLIPSGEKTWSVPD